MNSDVRERADYGVRAVLLFSSCLLSWACAFAVERVPDRAPPGDIPVDVELDTGGQAGKADATVRIHARREVVWSLITSCAEALQLVPGLVECEVMQTAPDRSWQTIRHVLDYSWFVRHLVYEIRATYDVPAVVSIDRISGDLKTLKVSWNLKSDGDYTVARYRVELATGFWVPQWLVRGALKRDLPKMLHAVRARAETVARRSG